MESPFVPYVSDDHIEKGHRKDHIFKYAVFIEVKTKCSDSDFVCCASYSVCEQFPKWHKAIYVCNEHCLE